jgi:hypothetical protein
MIVSTETVDTILVLVVLAWGASGLLALWLDDPPFSLSSFVVLTFCAMIAGPIVLARVLLDPPKPRR